MNRTKDLFSKKATCYLNYIGLQKYLLLNEIITINKKYTLNINNFQLIFMGLNKKKGQLFGLLWVEVVIHGTINLIKIIRVLLAFGKNLFFFIY